MDKTMENNADEVVLDTEKNEELVELEAESHETDSTTEATSEEEQAPEEVAELDEPEAGGDDEDNEVRARLNRAHQQIERLKSENARLKDGKVGKAKVGDPSSVPVEHVDKALLAAYGFKAVNDQILIKQLARKSGLSIVEALEDDFTMERFQHMKKRQQVQQASARPTSKQPAAQKNPSYYIDKGIMPRDPETARAVRAELARRSASQYS
jgi:hypothetical protein